MTGGVNIRHICQTVVYATFYVRKLSIDRNVHLFNAFTVAVHRDFRRRAAILFGDVSRSLLKSKVLH